MVEFRMQRDEPEHLSICDCVSLDEQEDHEASMFHEEQGSQLRTTTATDDSAGHLSNEMQRLVTRVWKHVGTPIPRNVNNK